MFGQNYGAQPIPQVPTQVINQIPQQQPIPPAQGQTIPPGSILNQPIPNWNPTNQFDKLVQGYDPNVNYFDTNAPIAFGTDPNMPGSTPASWLTPGPAPVQDPAFIELKNTILQGIDKNSRYSTTNRRLM